MKMLMIALCAACAFGVVAVNGRMQLQADEKWVNDPNCSVQSQAQCELERLNKKQFADGPIDLGSASVEAQAAVTEIREWGALR